MSKSDHRLRGKSKKNGEPGINGISNKNIPDISEFLCFSFKELDVSQYQKETFNTWKGENKNEKCREIQSCLLVNLLDTIKNISTMKRQEAEEQKVLNVYGEFPPTKKTKYTYPKHISEDANWGTIHIQGKEVLAGHIVDNIFSVVFLDKDHKFWISDKKNT